MISRDIVLKNSKIVTSCDLLLLVLLGTFICFFRLDDFSFHHVDESTHVRVTQEMLHGGDWKNPAAFGKPYYNKPPFKMWLSLFPVTILGESNFSYRFLDALCGLATALLLYGFSRIVFRSRIMGIFSALSLLGCKSYLFNHGVRNANQDSMLVFLLSVALMSAWFFLNAIKARDRNFSSRTWQGQGWQRYGWQGRIWKYAIIGGVAVGCSVLTKNVAGYMTFIILLPYLIISGEWRKLVSNGLKPLALIIALSLLLPALYVIPRSIGSGAMMTVFFEQEVYNRAVQGYHNRTEPFYYITRILFKRSAVSPEILILGMVLATIRFYTHRDKRFLFILCWAITPVLFFSLIPSRLGWYIAPAFPGMALLVGSVFATLLNSFKHRLKLWWQQRATSLVTTAGLGFVLLCCLLALSHELAVVFDRVLFKGERIDFDRMVQDLNQQPHPQRGILYKNPLLAKNEIIYKDMLGTIRPVNSSAEATQLLATNEITYLIAPVSEFAEIAALKQFTAYLFLPPSTHRTKWLVTFFYGDPKDLREFKLADETIDIGDRQDPVFSGWHGPYKLPDLTTVRNTAGTKPALALEGELARRTFGTEISLRLEPIKNKEYTISSITLALNGENFGSCEIPRDDFSICKATIPPERWISGKNLLTLSLFLADGKTPKNGMFGLVVDALTIKLQQGSPAQQ
jgi:4-amino-4-deoxy-L-arabinose transferase-like glycosyltransferase